MTNRGGTAGKYTRPCSTCVLQGLFVFRRDIDEFPGYDFCIEKIRTGMHVCQTGVNNFNRLSVCCLQRFQCEKFVFPHVVQEFFHVNEV